jgi:nucleotide-binding universal stress UspA family protein
MRIVALIDLRESTPLVLKVATDLARAFGAELALLYVTMPDTEPEDTDDVPADTSRQGIAHRLRKEQRTMQVLARERNRLGVNTTAHVIRSTSRRGRPTAKISKRLRQVRADFVVTGSHHHGRLRELFLETVTHAVIRAARCPVVVVPIPRRGRAAAEKAAQMSS